MVAIADVKMRWLVIVEIHGDDNSRESADLWHIPAPVGAEHSAGTVAGLEFNQVA
jgi:hypothetical protein